MWFGGFFLVFLYRTRRTIKLSLNSLHSNYYEMKSISNRQSHQSLDYVTTGHDKVSEQIGVIVIQNIIMAKTNLSANKKT